MNCVELRSDIDNDCFRQVSYVFKKQVMVEVDGRMVTELLSFAIVEVITAIRWSIEDIVEVYAIYLNNKNSK